MNQPIRISFSMRLSMLLLFFVMMFLALGAISPIFTASWLSERSAMLWISALQAIMVFSIPAIAEAALEGGNPFHTVGISAPVNWKSISWTVGVLLCAIPAMNALVYWNENITFPAAFQSLEATFRAWEESSLAMTKVLLSTTSIGGLLAGILVIGVLTGIGEELFFRAGLQRILASRLSPQLAVWVAALIFSAAHFQFFGFFPRLILGAFLGYLYLWTGSIRLSILAHALNNSLVVFFGWLTANGISNNFDFIGTPSHLFWLAPVSLLAILLLLFKLGIRS